jgi:hypothetical protein
MRHPCVRSFAELPNYRVPDLSTAEQFVVGVFRCWDAFLADPDRQLAWRELYPVFAYMGVVRALCAVDAAFQVVRHSRLRGLTFHDVDNPTLSLAEARVLCGLASLQRADSRAAAAALRGAISTRGIASLLAPFARIAGVLAAEGHPLPRWHDSPDATRTAQVQKSVPQIREGVRRSRLRDVEALRETDA